MTDRYAEIRKKRRAEILRAAVSLASQGHYRTITRDQVAATSGYSAGLINHIFGTMAKLRDAVMQEAVDTRRLDIVAQGLADKHVVALDAPLAIKDAASRALA